MNVLGGLIFLLLLLLSCCFGVLGFVWFYGLDGWRSKMPLDPFCVVFMILCLYWLVTDGK